MTTRLEVWVNLLLFGTHFTEKEFCRILDGVKGAGGSGVEVPVLDDPPGCYRGLGVFAGYQNAAKARGLGVSAVGMVDRLHDPSSLDRDISQEGLLLLTRQIHRASALGSTVLCGPLVLPWKDFPVDAAGNRLTGNALVDHIGDRLQRAVLLLQDVADYAARRNIVLYLEYLKGWELPGLNLLEQVIDFVLAVNRQNFGILFDSCHETSDGRGPRVFIDQMRRVLAKKIPVWDHASAPGQRGDITETWINWDGIFDTRKGMGWRGPLVLEIFNATEPFASGVCINRAEFANPFAILKKGIEFLQTRCGTFKVPAGEPSSASESPLPGVEAHTLA